MTLFRHCEKLASMDQQNLAGKAPAQLLVEKRAEWEKGGEYSEWQMRDSRLKENMHPC